MVSSRSIYHTSHTDNCNNVKVLDMKISSLVSDLF